MDFKKILAGIFVIGLFASLIGFNTVSAKKSSAVKMEPETIESMANQVDNLTKKVYGRALLSPEDNSNLVAIKIKLDNQMLLEPDPALAPLYYKVGCMYKMREMKDEATECYQTILENFGTTALAPKAYQALKDMGVDVTQFDANMNKSASEDEEEEEE